jgi:hypothetical protein
VKIGMRRAATGIRTGIFVLVIVGVLGSICSAALAQIVRSVEAVGMTVSDMDRSVQFFSKVLSFEKISDVEVHGAEFEKWQGVFGLRMRVARLKLGGESIDLTQYLAPEGRPMPAGWRNNDHWFQHVAIVVSDMDMPISICAPTKSGTPPRRRKRFRRRIRPLKESAPFISKTTTGTIWRLSIFPRAKESRAGNKKTTRFSWASTIPP